MINRFLELASEFRAAAPDDGPWTFETLQSRYRLYDDGSITVAYAPMDHINVRAQVVFLGITPGLQQAQIAFATSREMLGAPVDDVGKEIKRRAAFAGSMRHNLVSMLDDLGLHSRLGVTSVATLFAEHDDLLQSTSILRYPVFRKGKNYPGYSPEPTQHSTLSSMIERILVPELCSVPRALVVPLGGAVERVLQHLTERGLLSDERWLRGFPHPSGANGHRKSQFLKNRERLSADVERWFARNALS